MIILSVDHGYRHIGLAISDETELIASRLNTIHVKNYKKGVLKVAAIAKEKKAGMILIGLPLLHNGTDSEQTRAARKFAADVSKETQLDYLFWNEYLTSQIAEINVSLKNSHSEAARVILQEYLDKNKNTTE